MAHASAIEAFVPMNSPIEGVVHWLYLDVKNFLTAAMGCLADPVERALAMPWRLPNGELASKAQVISEWKALKARPDLSKYAASNHVVESATTIRLLDSDISAVVQTRLLATEQRMRHFFKNWDYFPADAQLALLSMGWALGSDFETGYPRLTAAANLGEWETCANECEISHAGNAGVIARNTQNVLLFHNANAVSELHLDPETLHWPAHAPTVDPQIHQAAALAFSQAPFPASTVALDNTVFSPPSEAT